MDSDLTARSGEALTCWGLSDMCAELRPKCRAAGTCVLAPPDDQRAQRSAHFDAKVRTHGYVDRVTGERIYDPDKLIPQTPKARDK